MMAASGARRPVGEFAAIAVLAGISLGAIASIVPGDHGLLEWIGTFVLHPENLPAVLLLLAALAVSGKSLLFSQLTSGVALLVLLTGDLWNEVADTFAFASAVAMTATPLVLMAARYSGAVAMTVARRLWAAVASLVVLVVVISLHRYTFDHGMPGVSPIRALSAVICLLVVMPSIAPSYPPASRDDLRGLSGMLLASVAVIVASCASMVIGDSFLAGTALKGFYIALLFGVAAVAACIVLLLFRQAYDNACLSRRNRKTERLAKMLRDGARRRLILYTSSERRYRALFHGLPAPLMVTSPSGEVVSANSAMAKLFECKSLDEFMRKDISDFYQSKTDREVFMQAWRTSGKDEHSGEIQLKTVSGKTLDLIFHGTLVRAPDGAVEYQQGVFTDVTALKQAERERRAMESELRLAQKLESVGRLAAGVAHEINTPMQYVGDNVFFLESAFADLVEVVESGAETAMSNDNDQAEELRETLALVPGAFDRAREGIASVSRIVSAMKDLAHPDSGTKVSVNVNDLVRTASIMTRSEYKAVADLETEFGDVPAILAHKNELTQVLINLIVNATHAIEAVAEDKPDRGRIRVSTGVRGSQVVVEIADTGCGIPKSLISRIFDPFFTTKPVGKGTGQGLAIARATVVDRHGGSIDIESEPNQGTRFTICLPADNRAV